MTATRAFHYSLHIFGNNNSVEPDHDACLRDSRSRRRTMTDILGQSSFLRLPKSWAFAARRGGRVVPAELQRQDDLLMG